MNTMDTVSLMVFWVLYSLYSFFFPSLMEKCLRMGYVGKTFEMFFSNRWIKLQQEIIRVLQCCSSWDVVVLFGASALTLSSIPLWNFTHELKLSIICLSCREGSPVSRSPASRTITFPQPRMAQSAQLGPTKPALAARHRPAGKPWKVHLRAPWNTLSQMPEGP